MGYFNPAVTVDATIANGAALSGAVELTEGQLVGMLMPSAWTAAAVSFDVSQDGATYAPLYNGNGEVRIASTYISTSERRFFALDPVDFLGWKFVKVRSGLNGAAVAQGAGRTVTLVMRGV